MSAGAIRYVALDRYCDELAYADVRAPLNDTQRSQALSRARKLGARWLEIYMDGALIGRAIPVPEREQKQ